MISVHDNLLFLVKDLTRLHSVQVRSLFSYESNFLSTPAYIEKSICVLVLRWALYNMNVSTDLLGIFKKLNFYSLAFY